MKLKLKNGLLTGDLVRLTGERSPESREIHERLDSILKEVEAADSDEEIHAAVTKYQVEARKLPLKETEALEELSRNPWFTSIDTVE